MTPTETLDHHIITMKAEFVPFSRSRNKNDKSPSLNWKVTILKDGREVLTTDYSAGCGHCPSYKQADRSVYQAEIVAFECENGLEANANGRTIRAFPKTPIIPKLTDVMYSLLMDADVLNAFSYEDWASNLGYDPDSRKGEALYRQCLDHALKLRNGIGQSTLDVLSEAFQGY